MSYNFQQPTQNPTSTQPTIPRFIPKFTPIPPQQFSSPQHTPSQSSSTSTTTNPTTTSSSGSVPRPVSTLSFTPKPPSTFTPQATNQPTAAPTGGFTPSFKIPQFASKNVNLPPPSQQQQQHGQSQQPQTTLSFSLGQPQSRSQRPVFPPPSSAGSDALQQQSQHQQQHLSQSHVPSFTPKRPSFTASRPPTTGISTVHTVNPSTDIEFDFSPPPSSSVGGIPTPATPTSTSTSTSTTSATDQPLPSSQSHSQSQYPPSSQHANAQAEHLPRFNALEQHPPSNQQQHPPSSQQQQALPPQPLQQQYHSQQQQQPQQHLQQQQHPPKPKPTPSNPYPQYEHEDDIPLLEELGIDLPAIFRKTIAILRSPISVKSTPLSFVDEDGGLDTDLAGPLVYCLLLGVCLLFSGKIRFGYIFGFGIMGCFLMKFLLSVMCDGSITLDQTMHILGYSVTPILFVAILRVVFNLDGAIGQLFVIAMVIWSTVIATIYTESALDMQKQRYLIAYPIGLLYICFALLALF